MNFSEAERWEIIDGVPYSMSPAPSRKHQKISSELFASMHNYLRGKSCEVYSAPFDVRLNINNEEDEDIINVVQPDISVICDSIKLDDKGCKGRPEVYSEEDKIKVGIFESLEVNLNDIFAD